ncbi:MAG: PAS domain S-box protein, partial [Chloroflexales bacterium]|nr:PAS domain S-box protein [Chloroflexales bacterium]
MSTSGQRPTLRTWQIAPLIFAGGLGISVLLFVIIWSGETRALASELDADAAMAVTSLDNTLEVALDDLKSLESFFGASELLTRAEFQGFTRRELFGAQATPGVQAFFWAPIVPATERPAYEAAAVREGLVGFRFRERLGAEGLIAAEARDEYIPIYYLEPRAGNECALGLDLASDPTLRSTLVAARSSHNVHMAEVRALCAPDDGAQQILLVRPVLKGLEGHTVDGVSAPSGTLAGYMASTLRLDELVAAALDNQRLDDLQVYLFDRTAEIPLGAYSTGSATQPAPAGPPPASARDGLSAVATMEIGGHQWELIIRPTWRYVVARRTLMPWMILTVGLSFTGLAVLYVWQRRQAEERLLVYRQIVSATRDLLAFFDRDQICRAVNDAYLSTYGKGRSETVGRHMRDLLGAAAYTERVKPIMDRVLQGEEVRFETWLALGGGAPRFVEARYIPYDDQNGTAAGVVVIVHDLTERKMVEDELRQAATVFENTLEGVMITDPDLVMVAVNRAFSEITGYSKAEAIGQTPRMLQSGRQDQAFYQQMWAAIKQQGRWQGEVWNRRKNGEIYPEWLTVSCVTNEDGQVVNYIAVFSDISHLKRSEEQLAHLAHYDALTDLPNRLLLYSRLEHALERAERHSTQVAVLFIDLDRFKNINDSLGHPAGDEVLVAIAHRLKERLRISDTIARLGGDEFVVL